MRSSCKDCPRRPVCRRICPDIERLLPPADGSTRAELSIEGKLIAWAIQDFENQLLPRQREAAYFYYRLGLSEGETARKLGVKKAAVCRMLKRIRKKLAEKCKQNVLVVLQV